jgi:hypothetical protein
MMFNNPWNPYNPYQNQQAFAQQAPQRREVDTVNGRPGAEQFPLGPDSNVILLDKTAPIVWFVQTDSAGYKSLSPYSISPYQPEAPVDVKALLHRVEKLEAMINANESDPAENANAQ